MARRSNPRRTAREPASKQARGVALALRKPSYPESLFMLPPEDEYIRLWRHVLYGTGTCLGMIEGYTRLNMPGSVLEDLYKLRDQLNSIISVHEAKNGRKTN